MNKLFVLCGSVLLLAGCSEFKEPISSENEGIWNEFFIWPMVQVIQWLAEFSGTYALAIILMTVMIKLCLLPFTLKQVKSAKDMQNLQPQLRELQAKYSSKDAETQQQYQQEMMQLMKNAGVNPLAGCLPVVIQMPILLGLYHAISRMNVTPMFDLGVLFTVPLATPSILLAVLAGLLQYAVIATGAKQSSGLQMKVVQYVMPLSLVFFGMLVPAAITLYWSVSSLLSIVQNIFLYRNTRAQLEVID